MANNLFQKDIGQVSPPRGSAPVSPPPVGLDIASTALSTVGQGLKAYLSRPKPAQPTKDEQVDAYLKPVMREVDLLRQQYERDGDMMAFRTRAGQIVRRVAVDRVSMVDDLNDAIYEGYGFRPEEDEAAFLQAEGVKDPDWFMKMGLAEITKTEEGMKIVAAAHLSTPPDATPEERALIVEDAVGRYIRADAEVTSYAQINDDNVKGAKLTGMAGSIIPAMAKDYFGAAMSPESVQAILQTGEGYRVYEAVQEANRSFEETFLRLGAEKGYSFSEDEQETLFGRTRQGIKSWGKIIGTSADESLAARDKHVRNIMLDWMVGDGKVATPQQLDAIEQQMAILNHSKEIQGINSEFLEYLKKENAGNKQYATLMALTDIVDIVPQGSVVSKDLEGRLDIMMDDLRKRNVSPAEIFHVSQGVLNAISSRIQEAKDIGEDFGTQHRLRVSAANMSVVSSEAAFNSNETLSPNDGTVNVAMESVRSLLSEDYGESVLAIQKSQDRAVRNINKQKARVNQEVDGAVAGIPGIGKDTYLSPSGKAVRGVLPDSSLGNLIALWNEKNNTNLEYDTSSLQVIGQVVSTGGEGVYSNTESGIPSDARSSIAMTEMWVASNYGEFDKLDVIGEIDKGLRAFSKENPHLKPQLLSTKPVGRYALQDDVNRLVAQEAGARSADFTDAPQIDTSGGIPSDASASMQTPDGTPVSPSSLQQGTEEVVNSNEPNPAIVEEVEPETPFRGIEGEFLNYIPDEVANNKPFVDKLGALADELNVPVDSLAAIIAFETGNSWSPSKRNIKTGKATGLIQFMPRTAEGLGTTTDELAEMTHEEQMDYVRAYFKQHAGKLSKSEGTISDLYMAVLWPRAIGKPDDYVLWRKGTTAYDQNSGLDVGNKGYITKGDAAKKVVDNWKRVTKSRST